MRILVAGSGAIGSVFGGFLRRAGHDVTLLGRERHLEAIRARGLLIDGLWGAARVDGFGLATESVDLRGPYDLALVSVKSFDTEAIVHEILPHMAPGALVASLQNGLGNVETLAAAFGADRSLGASIHVGAQVPEPGCVTVTVQAAPVVVGAVDSSAPEAMARAAACTELFAGAGIPCQVTDQIVPYLWAKVLYNAPLNALSALLNVHYGALGEDADLRAIMDAIMAETFRVAEGQGVALAWPSPGEYQRHFYANLLPPTASHRGSMLQDLERGHRTEIHAINGAVWRRGAELGVPTPFNELMTRLVSWREKRGHQAAGPAP